jgi:hypothetical protein
MTFPSRPLDRVPLLTAAAGAALLLAAAAPARAQTPRTVDGILSFLLTNRSIPTEDFTTDAQAAAAMRDAIAGFMLTELTTLPLNSPSSGFTYRLDPSLGTTVRSSDSFGPFFVGRSLTGGRRQASFGVSYQRARYDEIDGRSLRDGSLVATATRLRGTAEPFDVETLTMRIETNTMTMTANVGITDRLDIGAALPLVRLTLEGERLDTYRGTRLIQASALASASGVGDLVVRAKYNMLRRGGSGLTVAAEARLPTGDEQNLLGAGRASIAPRILASLERDRMALHGEFGVSRGGRSDEIHYGAALTVVAASRMTLVGELTGRRLGAGGRLVDVIDPHPALIGIDTIRLSSTAQPTSRVALVTGVRWNIAARSLLSVSLLRPLTSAGLNARWVPTVTFDCSLGR